jgi:photosystem II stability/assembly factor-like uncharacterized protein
MKSFLLLLCVFVSPLLMKSQPWLGSLEEEDRVDFFDIQRSFDRYWMDKPRERGVGFNIYKRWEWFWEQRVGKSGTFPKPGHDMDEWEEWMNRHNRRNDFGGNWRSLGPDTSMGWQSGLGRLNCIAFHPTDSATFWVGSPSGGIWKTTNYGKTWSTSSDRNPVLGVSSILVHPTNPDTLYIATGDGNRGALWGMTNVPLGDNKSIGVLRSVDGGKSWQPTGLSWQQHQTHLIGKMVFHPTSPHVIYAATSAGIFRTTNSGVQWEQVAAGYFRDIVFHPVHHDTIYAATFVSAGGARVFRSVNGGNDFIDIFHAPTGNRIVIATTPLLPNVLQFIVSNINGGLLGIYESTQSGQQIQQIFQRPNILSSAIDGSGQGGQGWYDLAYTFSPNDPNVIYAGGINIWKSTDRGRTFRILTHWTPNPSIVRTATHADKHVLIHHPLEQETLFDCNDGGLYVSRDGGIQWNELSNGLIITQFYRFDVHPTDTQIILCGSQDNGNRVSNNKGEWSFITLGDGMQCAIDKEFPNHMYNSTQFGRIYYSDDGFQTPDMKTISINIPGRPTGAWVTPFKLLPGKSGSLIAGYQDVYFTSNYGTHWERRSFDLIGGKEIRNLEVGNQNTNIWYAGDFFNIYISMDAGFRWQKIADFNTPVTMMKVDPENDSILYITFSSYQSDTKVMKYDGTLSGKGRLTNLTFNLPNVSVNCLSFHPGRKEALYVGTDIGVFYRDITSQQWKPFSNGMPNVIVTELVTHDHDNLIFACTYGRGLWKSNLYQNSDPPVITNLQPKHESKKVRLDEEFIVTFNDLISKGTGDIYIYKEDDLGQTLHEILPMRSTNVKVNDNKLQFKPEKTLEILSRYHISIGNEAVRKRLGVSFAGSKPEDWIIETDSFIPGDQRLEDRVRIYPIPSRDNIHIECPTCGVQYKVRLYDMYGKKVKEAEGQRIKTEMNIQDLTTGLYYLEFIYIRNTYIRKIMVHQP